MEHELEYEIVRNDKNSGPIGRVWWDGKKVGYSTSKVKMLLNNMSIDGKTVSDGPEFLKILQRHWKSGYVSVRKVK